MCQVFISIIAGICIGWDYVVGAGISRKTHSQVTKLKVSSFTQINIENEVLKGEVSSKQFVFLLQLSLSPLWQGLEFREFHFENGSKVVMGQVDLRCEKEKFFVIKVRVESFAISCSIDLFTRRIDVRWQVEWIAAQHFQRILLMLIELISRRVVVVRYSWRGYRMRTRQVHLNAKLFESFVRLSIGESQIGQKLLEVLGGN